MAYGLYVAKVPFFYRDENGQEVNVAQGAIVRGGHSMLDGREELFDELKVDYDVETKSPAKSNSPGQGTQPRSGRQTRA